MHLYMVQEIRRLREVRCLDNNFGNGYENSNSSNNGKRKVGRPQKIDSMMMLKLKEVYSGTRANKRHLQNHYYQMRSLPIIQRYNTENPIDNFTFLCKDEVYFKETIFTELGRTERFIEENFSVEEAEQYIIDMAIQICELAKTNKLTSRIVEKIIRDDRKELKKRLKENIEENGE